MNPLWGLFLAGVVCFSNGTQNGQPNLIQLEQVPFISQKPEFCGPACLAMVLNYYGVRFDQEQLAQEIYRKELGGTINLELLLAARRHGFEAQAGPGTREKILVALKNKNPVIVQIAPQANQKFFHYLLIYGFDPDEDILIAHSGNSRGIRLPWKKFQPRWEQAGNWMLIISQKDTWP